MKKAVAQETLTAEKVFAKYVLQNILGMLGISAYILADTFFISRAEGAEGIAALNLVLPLYSLIFALGSMMGVGAATRFKICRARNEKRADFFFSNSVMFAVFLGLIFVVCGACMPEKIIAFLGGDAKIIAVGTDYTRIFLLFSPFFMLNYICNAFVRNDGAPSLAMIATLFSSLFNIVMDYVLMFPLKLGMAGAALATVFSPIVGSAICCMHFFSAKNTVRFRLAAPSVKCFVQSCQLGVAAFVGEMSSGVTTMVFNILILGIAGNTGIAAYGIVANAAIVATSIFNGIANGTQPLFSEFYGKNDSCSVKKTLRLSLVTACVAAVGMVWMIYLLADGIVDIFNQEQNAEMAVYAVSGIKRYFTGFLFAGFNIVGTGYLSATESAGWAFAVSVLRGFAAIIVCAFVLAKLFGMTGIWMAFPAAECMTMAVMLLAVRKSMSGKTVQ